MTKCTFGRSSSKHFKNKGHYKKETFRERVLEGVVSCNVFKAVNI